MTSVHLRFLLSVKESDQRVGLIIIPTSWGSERMTYGRVGKGLCTGADTHRDIIPTRLALTLGPPLSWGTPSWLCAALSKRQGWAALP